MTDFLGSNREACLAGFADLLAALPVTEAWRATIAARYAEPWRRYHDAAHPGLLWQRHLAWGGSPSMAELALAVAFHDAVLVVGAPDNEARSAALLLQAVPGAVRAAAAVEATADHVAYADDDPIVLRLLDLDLTPLAEPAALFHANTLRLRDEARHLDEAAFIANTCVHFIRLRAASRLFRTTEGARYEAMARVNLDAVLTDCRDGSARRLPDTGRRGEGLETETERTSDMPQAAEPHR